MDWLFYQVLPVLFFYCLAFVRVRREQLPDELARVCMALELLLLHYRFYNDFYILVWVCSFYA